MKCRRGSCVGLQQVQEDDAEAMPWRQWTPLQRAEAAVDMQQDRQSEGQEGVASVDYEALGSEAGCRRKSLRHRRACAVCARLAWHTEHEEVYFWKQEDVSPRQSFISDCVGSADVGATEDCGQTMPEAAGVSRTKPTAREQAQILLSPKRYYERWKFLLPRESDQAPQDGGIPLEELEASAVRDPAPGGKLWLLHRKVFRMVKQKNTQGEEVEVADPHQRVPVCLECRCALQGQKPKMPKYSLANDLWMGKEPAVFTKLSVGARMLLPLARSVIRRYNCLNDSGKWMPYEQRIKGFVGNVVAFPQSDGGAVLNSLPPTAASMIDSLVIAFAGSVEDLK